MFSWKIGRVAGIDLYLHPTFLLLLGFIGLTQGGLLAVLFTSAVFGCVVLHELGHALTARAFGIPTRDITLYPIGGVARLDRIPRAPGAELLITLAGPAVNVVIAAVLALALSLNPSDAGSFFAEFVGTLMTVNLLLAAFNMIPAFPMDGGRVLRAVLSGWLGRLRATEIAAGIGRGLAIGLPLIIVLVAPQAFSWMQVIMALFIYWAAGAELAQVRHECAARAMRTAGPSTGIWTAPLGYRWVHQGGGFWRLVPATAPFTQDSSATRWS